MSKMNLIIVLGLILHIDYALAAVPVKIDLDYDDENEMLHVDVTHYTNDRGRHYVREVVVYKNDEKPVVLYFRQQINSTHFIIEIPLSAKSGDVIRVRAMDSHGGAKNETITIPEPKTK